MAAIDPPPYGDPIYALQPKLGPDLLTVGSTIPGIVHTTVYEDLIVTSRLNSTTGNVKNLTLLAHRINPDGSVTSGPGLTLNIFTEYKLAWVAEGVFVIFGFKSITGFSELRVELYSVDADDLSMAQLDTATVSPWDSLLRYTYHPDRMEVIFMRRPFSSGAYRDLLVRRVSVTTSAVGDFTALETHPATGVNGNVEHGIEPFDTDNYLLTVASSSGTPYTSLFNIGATPAESVVVSTGIDALTGTWVSGGSSPYRLRGRLIGIAYGGTWRSIHLDESAAILEDLMWDPSAGDAAFLAGLPNDLDNDVGIGTVGFVDNVQWLPDSKCSIFRRVYTIDHDTEDWIYGPMGMINRDIFSGTPTYELYREPDDYNDTQRNLFGFSTGELPVLLDTVFTTSVVVGRMEVLDDPTTVLGIVQPDSGEKVIKYTSSGTPDTPTSLTLIGPSTAEQGDSEKHRGKFAVDQNTRNVSTRLKVGTTDADIWVVPTVEFFSTDSGGDPTIEMGATSFTPVAVPAAPVWRKVDIFGGVPDGVSHYDVVLKMFSDAALTTPLPADTDVYLDSMLVPESGHDLRDGKQPYLDGDQPFGIWEGEERNSTSVYGQKPVTNLSQIMILDDDFPFYFATQPETP